MKIAVKTIPPGVNDPGTAIEVINKLGVLFNKSLQILGKIPVVYKDSSLQVMKTAISIEKLISTIIQPIRLYEKYDNSILYGLTITLNFIVDNKGIKKEDRDIVKLELVLLKMM